MRTRQRITVCLSALALVLIAGCGPIGNGEDPAVSETRPETVLFVLVDVSKSTYGSQGAQRQKYAAAFDRILSAVPPGTLLMADVIDSNPLSTASLPIKEFFKKYEGFMSNENEREVKNANEAAGDRAAKAFGELLRRQPKGNSILDSLDIAQNVFANFPTATTRYLIVFSDMVENSERYRFTNLNLQEDNVREFISVEERGARLPDLSSVQAYVVGAGATRGADATPERTRMISDFWLAYFEAAGATLPSSRYGPTLITFP